MNEHRDCTRDTDLGYGSAKKGVLSSSGPLPRFSGVTYCLRCFAYDSLAVPPSLSGLLLHFSLGFGFGFEFDLPLSRLLLCGPLRSIFIHFCLLAPVIGVPFPWKFGEGGEKYGLTFFSGFLARSRCDMNLVGVHCVVRACGCVTPGIRERSLENWLPTVKDGVTRG